MDKKQRAATCINGTGVLWTAHESSPNTPIRPNVPRSLPGAKDGLLCWGMPGGIFGSLCCCPMAGFSCWRGGVTTDARAGLVVPAAAAALVDDSDEDVEGTAACFTGKTRGMTGFGASFWADGSWGMGSLVGGTSTGSAFGVVWTSSSSCFAGSSSCFIVSVGISSSCFVVSLGASSSVGVVSVGWSAS